MLSDAFRLAVRDVQSDLSSFHLLKYSRQVDGYLFSSKNSGTHWLRAMLSAAIAHKLGLDPPAYSNGPAADAFICHPKKPRQRPDAPKIGCSHTIPSRLTLIPLALGVGRLPPTVVLARSIPEALSSYYVKWGADGALGTLSDFIRRPAPGEKRIDDLWWYVRFFNRWGWIAEKDPKAVLIVRYEQLQSDPADVIRRVWAHWGVRLSAADVAAGVEAGSRQSMTARMDPVWNEATVSDPQARAKGRLSPWDRAFLWRRLAKHMHYTLWPTPADAGAPAMPPTVRPAPAGTLSPAGP
ncbi:MAG TPA: sulfotransferase domain-containing protein [Caulobacteraceae bacterium]|nr:sulfotransferase domain-containing protein [Caulobacteraceae bacterium]